MLKPIPKKKAKFLFTAALYSMMTPELNIGQLYYKFQWQSVGDAAVYFDTQTMGHTPLFLLDVQLNAVLASNKRLLGYIIIAGVGVLTFVLAHSFGQSRQSFAV